MGEQIQSMAPVPETPVSGPSLDELLKNHLDSQISGEPGDAIPMPPPTQEQPTGPGGSVPQQGLIQIPDHQAAEILGALHGLKDKANQNQAEAIAAKEDASIWKGATEHAASQVGSERANNEITTASNKTLLQQNQELKGTIPVIAKQAEAKGQGDMMVKMITDAATKGQVDLLANQKKTEDFYNDQISKTEAAQKVYMQAASAPIAGWSDAFREQTGAEATLMITKALIGVWRRSPEQVVQSFEDFAIRKASELNKSRQGKIDAAKFGYDSISDTGKLKGASLESQRQNVMAMYQFTLDKAGAIQKGLSNEAQRATIGEIMASTKLKMAQTAETYANAEAKSSITQRLAGMVQNSAPLKAVPAGLAAASLKIDSMPWGEGVKSKAQDALADLADLEQQAPVLRKLFKRAEELTPNNFMRKTGASHIYEAVASTFTEGDQAELDNIHAQIRKIITPKLRDESDKEGENVSEKLIFNPRASTRADIRRSSKEIGQALINRIPVARLEAAGVANRSNAVNMINNLFGANDDAMVSQPGVTVSADQ